MPNYRRSQVPGGTWFFTLTLADRQSRLLVEEVERLRHAYRQTQRTRPFQTVAVCVLPDHLHAIWTLPEGDADYAGRWSLLKSTFSRQFPAATQSPSKARKREKSIWQRRFWEHQIRDESDLQRHVEYIHYNPVKHGLVEQVADWTYSSFHRYVEKGLLPKDWACSAEANGTFGE
ncbi:MULTISPECIES: REP-associated tyrosine transposase [Pseudomonadaceae]|uniref:REP-associated tyrosine transposase n=1 Tax=Pseudomonadaceae TaxID=135621 RepID=UPI0015E2E4A7|nr:MULTISPECIES: transposase [Pseudomonadaceae]MBA1276183.1 transposase [Stutzerimonas stutzeri]MBC8648693.1 transposase [Pseudomonas sp. MT4]QXY92675.1 transposase [Pseudomonas sp. MTM4]